ncbi:DUF3007 domain containing protein [Nitzschia inconspicua]|uniref:DUF3007 domain containing protein n=1 Tax=Nitzschia inconspicua TaxID=303405 RepID=A0A9K3KCB3_9STRA|nr:DUF3007 domain containing protein [Nitzschia inconspicua]KAG7367800.1 DUF3007 domain containing protein [Nitzschia inconspicua]
MTALILLSLVSLILQANTSCYAFVVVQSSSSTTTTTKTMVPPTRWTQPKSGTTVNIHDQVACNPKNFVFTATKKTISTTSTTTRTTVLSMASSDKDDTTKSNLPFWLDPGTRGGAVFLSFVLFLVPLIAYSVVTNVFGVDEVDAGKWIGVGFTATASLLWVGTYIFRVATKDMTYAKQLKDYENAVIAKRLEELDDDEIQALVEEIERDEF